MIGARAQALFFALLGAICCPGDAGARELPPVVVITIGGSGAGPTSQSQPAVAPLGRVRAALERSKRFTAQPLEALRPLMRQRDRSRRVRLRVAALREGARKALLALKHEECKKQLDAALALLRGSFVPFYEPAAIAQIQLLRGVLALQMARPDLAREAFVAAHQHDRRLKLDAHYSPQVRAAFAKAAQALPARPAPLPGELKRVLALSSAKLAVVLMAERSAAEVLAKALLFDGKRYAHVESRTMTDAAAAVAFGERLRQLLDRRFPPPKKNGNNGGRVIGPPPPPPPPPLPPRPWYKRWYVWVGAAAAVVAIGAAITAPLATRREVVDLGLKW